MAETKINGSARKEGAGRRELAILEMKEGAGRKKASASKDAFVVFFLNWSR